MRVRKLALLCALMSSIALAGCSRNEAKAIAIAGPSDVRKQCNDGIDNDGDGKIDYPNDTGCTGLEDDTENSDVPQTTTTTPPSNRPGPFRQSGPVTCTVTTTGERTISFGWTASTGATSYRVDESYVQTNSSIAVNGETKRVTETSVTFTRRRTAWQYKYDVYAVNSAGETLWENGRWTVPCAVIADVAPPPPPVSTTPTPAPGGGTNPPGTTTPPSGSSCGGSSAALPGSVVRGQTLGFAVSAPSSCFWTLTSNNTHVVSVNPASGTGPASGSITALNAGTATICFSGNGACQTYTVP